MSGLHNMNLLFYSTYDDMSKECMVLLSKAPDLNKQFIKICVHHPQNPNLPSKLKLPSFVLKMKNLNKIPVIAVAGFKKPIFAREACNWLKVHTENGGLQTIDIAGEGVADNCSTIEQAELLNSEYFNTEYNMGFVDGCGEIGKNYANINESASNKIVTYEDKNTKQESLNETQKRLEAIKNQRYTDAPQPMAKMIGIPPKMHNGLGYNPNIGTTGSSQLPQMPSRNGMPQMPPRNGMPQMPPRNGMPGPRNGMPAGNGMGFGQLPMIRQMNQPSLPNKRQSLPQLPAYN